MSQQRLHTTRAPRPSVTFAAITFTNAGRVLSRPLASHTHFIIVTPYYEERASQWQVFTSAFAAKQQDK